MTPEQEEQVRRALAATARPTDPPGGDAGGEDRPGGPSGGERQPDPTLPPAIAARLDGVLAELVAARSGPGTAPSTGPSTGSGGGSGTGSGTGSPTGSRTDELAARRARRWPNVLVAAAALAVIAVAGGAVATGGFGQGSGGGSDSAASSARDTTGKAPPSGEAGDGSRALAGSGLPRVRSATLAGDLQRVADARPAATAPSAGPSAAPSAGLAEGALPRCAPPTVPRGADVVDVRLDGEPAAVVLTVPVRGRSTALVYACDGPAGSSPSPVARATVRRR